MSPRGAPEGVQPTRGGPLTPSLPGGGCPPAHGGRVGRDGDRKGCVSPRESPSLVPQFPRRAAGRDRSRDRDRDRDKDRALSPLEGQQENHSSCSVPHGCPTPTPGDGDTAPAGVGSTRERGQGTSAGTRDPRNVPSPVCRRSRAATSRSPGDTRVCQRQGTVPSPGLCPGSAPTLGGFPGGKFHQIQSFPLEKWGLSPHSPPHSPPPRAQPPARAPLGTSARRCTCRALPWLCQEGPGHGGHLSGGGQPGVPVQGGGSGVTSSWNSGTGPLTGCPGWGTGPGRWQWR